MATRVVCRISQLSKLSYQWNASSSRTFAAIAGRYGNETMATPEQQDQRHVHKIQVRPLIPTSAEALASNVDLSLAPADFDTKDLLVVPNFLSKEEHDYLFDVAAAKVRRIAGRRYDEGHFDKVISNYRECTVSSWGSGKGSALLDPLADHPLAKEDPRTLAILRKVYLLFSPDLKWLPPHILDLREGDGEIRAHVDNVHASGGLVSALCLGSETVAVFRPVGLDVTPTSPCIRVLLPPGALYAQVGNLRYGYTHEIPGETEARTFRDKAIPKLRRISMMFRDELVYD